MMMMKMMMDDVCLWSLTPNKKFDLILRTFLLCHQGKEKNLLGP